MLKRDEYRLVKRDDVLEAGRRWQEVSDNQDHFCDFIKHLSLSYRVNLVNLPYFEVPQQTAERIQMLLGPNYKAIIRAWYAKRQETDV